MADYLRQLVDRITGREAERLRQRLHHTKQKLEAEKRNREEKVDRVRRLALDHGVYIYPQVVSRIDVTMVGDDERKTVPGEWEWGAADWPDGHDDELATANWRRGPDG